VLALTLTCSLILSRLDYCDAVLHGAPAGSIQKLQGVKNTAARIVLQALRRSHAEPLLEQLHWLPIHHRINYKLAVLTYKIRSVPISATTSGLGKLRAMRDLCSFSIPLGYYTHTGNQNSFCRLRLSLLPLSGILCIYSGPKWPFLNLG